MVIITALQYEALLARLDRLLLLLEKLMEREGCSIPENKEATK